MEKTIYIFITIVLLFLSGCSQKVTVKALKPAQIDEISKYKKIAVNNFSNDYIGFANKVESKLAKVKIDNKHYFKVIARRDTENILNEQRFQASGLVEKSEAIKVGKLLGAQAIINGSISDSSLKDTTYYEERTKCSDKKCKTTYTYKVRCTKRVVSLSIEVKILNTQEGDILYGDTFTQQKQFSHCSDDSIALPSRQYSLNSLADSISNEFIQMLAPYNSYYKVVLLDDPDIDYTDKQEELLKYSLKYIKNGRYDKAEKLLSRLLESTSDSSFVAAYNLGIIKERNGELQKAKQLYELADSITVKPNEEVDLAVTRIKSSINSRQEAMKQIKQ